jgi:hypothetical protein
MTDPTWPWAGSHQSSDWPWLHNVSTSETPAKGEDYRSNCSSSSVRATRALTDAKASPAKIESVIAEIARAIYDEAARR